MPEQALALLNDPFVTAMAKVWGERMAGASQTGLEEGIAAMFLAAVGRPAQPVEVERLATVARTCAAARGVAPERMATAAVVWQDVAHALFTMQEFGHVA